MPVVFSLRNVFEVAWAIVLLVSVFMVPVQTRGAWSKEGIHNEVVDVTTEMMLSPKAKSHHLIPIGGDIGLQDSGLPFIARGLCDPSNLPEAIDLVSAFKAWDWTPVDFCCKWLCSHGEPPFKVRAWLGSDDVKASSDLPFYTTFPSIFQPDNEERE